jgi:hypothetical protein
VGREEGGERREERGERREERGRLFYIPIMRRGKYAAK